MITKIHASQMQFYYIYALVHRRTGIEREYRGSESMEMVWHVERMDEYCMARMVLMVNVSGRRVLGRRTLFWMDGVKMALGSRGDLFRTAQKVGKSGELWFICGWLSLSWPFLHNTAFFRTALQRSSGLSPGEGWDAVT